MKSDVRLKSSKIRNGGVDGASMPAVFMTKKVEQKKVDTSVAFATKAYNAVSMQPN